MAATTTSSALDLLRPDLPVQKPDQPEKPEDEDDDDDLVRFVKLKHFDLLDSLCPWSFR